jgi:hypothetical protein
MHKTLPTHSKGQIIITILLLFIAFTGCSYLEKKNDPIAVLNQMQNMSDMATVEFVVSKVVKANDIPQWYEYGERKILISCKARIKAGINMREIGKDDIVINGKTVELRIPYAKVISLNMDTESIKEEYSKTDYFRSNFTNEDRFAFLAQAEKEIKESIPEMGVLVKANAYSVAFFESWLKLMGFEQVYITIKPEVKNTSESNTNSEQIYESENDSE